MENAQNGSSTLWTTLGRLPGGSVSALAVSGDAGLGDREILFAGTPVGLYRSDRWKEDAGWDWQRLNQAPVGIIALAVSPAYAADHTVFVGNQNGVWRSTDGGDTWQLAKMPAVDMKVLTLAASPDFQEDGILFAGTLESGVIFSDDRGETWTSRNAGLLDTMVMSVVFSPDFMHDGMVFAGTDTGLFVTSNVMRSWKRVALPGGMAPVTSLAVSPDFVQDGTLLVGTETNGLFRSRDRGKTVQRTSFPPVAVNALLIRENGLDLFAAGEDGVYRSTDQGDTWAHIQEMPDAISLTASGDRVLAGTVDDGLWQGGGEQPWAQVPELPARAIVDLKFSNGFEQDRTAFMAGPQEGVWRTRDGGQTWQSVNTGLTDINVTSLALSPSGLLAIACGEGVFVSEDGGDHWRAASNDMANLVAFSGTGGLLAASFPGLGLRTTKDLGASWEMLDGPWVKDGGQVISLAVSGEDHFHVAYINPANAMIGIWHGDGNRYKRLFNYTAGANPVTPFWCPAEQDGKEFWYMAFRQTVLLGTKDLSMPPQILSAYPLTAFPGLTSADTFLDIAGVREPGSDHLFVSTGRAIYHTTINPIWTLVHDFLQERAIKIVPSPTFSQDKTLYALLLGGVVCQGKFEE
jgi:photosystem II stability/assembly factor-like uncharacterized protein